MCAIGKKKPTLADMLSVTVEGKSTREPATLSLICGGSCSVVQPSKGSATEGEDADTGRETKWNGAISSSIVGF